MKFQHCQCKRKPRGFSMIEVVVATLIVGVMMVAAMNTLGAFIRGGEHMARQSRGWLLAQQLASEILAQAYEEPVDTPVFGRESSESGGRRTDYDDIDDYDGWDSAPPEDNDGTELVGLDRWRRAVTVEFVDADDPNTVVSTDQGLKRITVEVFCDDKSVARLVTYRSRSWLDPPFE